MLRKDRRKHRQARKARELQRFGQYVHCVKASMSSLTDQERLARKREKYQASAASRGPPTRQDVASKFGADMGGCVRDLD